jgi:hypothetical protein
MLEYRRGRTVLWGEEELEKVSFIADQLDMSELLGEPNHVWRRGLIAKQTSPCWALAAAMWFGEGPVSQASRNLTCKLISNGSGV